MVSPAVIRWFAIVMVAISTIVLAFNVAKVRSGNLQLYDGVFFASKEIATTIPAVFFVVATVVHRKLLKRIIVRYVQQKIRK